MTQKRTQTRIALGLGLCTALACVQPEAALGQPAAQSAAEANGVTVHAPKKSFPAEVQDFVGASEAPTRIGQLARWHDKICPKTLGLQPEFNQFVSDRILEIAAQAHAPVDKPETCHTNLLIVFTPDPQTLLDAVRKDKPYILGFHYTANEAQQLATVKHPIQGWYATATEDLIGRITQDDPGNDWQSTSNPDDIIANATHVEGSRISLGLSSQFSSVLVVADRSKIAGRPIGALADYVAFLALTQAKSLDDCRELPSIANMFAADCPEARTTVEATPADLAYLRGLYTTDPTLLGGGQPNAIAFEMRKALTAKSP